MPVLVMNAYFWPKLIHDVLCWKLTANFSAHKLGLLRSQSFTVGNFSKRSACFRHGKPPTKHMPTNLTIWSDLFYAIVIRTTLSSDLSPDFLGSGVAQASSLFHTSQYCPEQSKHSICFPQFWLWSLHKAMQKLNFSINFYSQVRLIHWETTTTEINWLPPIFTSFSMKIIFSFLCQLLCFASSGQNNCYLF